MGLTYTPKINLNPPALLCQLFMMEIPSPNQQNLPSWLDTPYQLFLPTYTYFLLKMTLKDKL